MRAAALLEKIGRLPLYLLALLLVASIAAGVGGTATAKIYPEQPSPGNQEKVIKQVLDRNPQGEKVVSGELLVSYERGTYPHAAKVVPRQAGARVKTDMPGLAVQLLTFPEVKGQRSQAQRQRVLEQKMEQLERNPDVEAVEYNVVLETFTSSERVNSKDAARSEPAGATSGGRRTSNATSERSTSQMATTEVVPTFTPNDPVYANQWNLWRIKMPETWSFAWGSPASEVAIVGSGVDPNHPDLKDKIAFQHDFANNDSVAEEPYDPTVPIAGSDRPGFLGTMEAGLIAASTNNGIGMAGVSPGSRLLIAKFFDPKTQVLPTLGTEVQAIDWSRQQGADVIYISFARPTNVVGYPAPSEVELRAVRDAWNSGAFVVAPAGDLAYLPVSRQLYAAYPAAYNDYVWSVGATGTTTPDMILGRSNQGNFLDIVAPGKDIYSTIPGGYYRSWGGADNQAGVTYLAAAQVAGFAGLMSGETLPDGSRRYSNSDIRTYMAQGAYDANAGQEVMGVSLTGWDPMMGYGRLDAYQTFLAGGNLPADVRAPETTITDGPAEGSTTSETSARFVFASSDAPSTFACSLDGAAYSTCTSPKDYANLSAGQHTFRVKATDAAGNTDPTPATRTWTVGTASDTAPPSISLTAPANGATVTGTSVTLSADATDNVAVSKVEFMINGNVVGTDASAPYSTNWNSQNVADGFVNVSAKATDTSNNSAATVQRRIAVDNTYPDTTITSGPSGTVSATTATFEFISTERDSTFRYSLDGGAYSSASSPKSFTGLSDGQHTFRVYAVGAGGEANDSDTTPASRTWTVSTAPVNLQTFQENNRDHTQYGNWSFYKNGALSGGYASSSDAKGSSAMFTFTGTNVAWKTTRFPENGITAVYLDGVKQANFNGYSSTGQFGVTGFSKSGLANTKHTLKLVVTGTKSANATDTDTDVDRFVVSGTTYQENSPKVAYDTWAGATNANASGGYYRQGTSASKAAYFYYFTGPRVDLITAKGPSRGSATLGVVEANSNTLVSEKTLNLKASTVGWQQKVSVTGLDPSKTYYLYLASSDGTPVVVDAYGATLAQTAQAANADKARATFQGAKREPLKAIQANSGA